MVPTFTCGLSRSNFSFPTGSRSFHKALGPASRRTSETYSSLSACSHRLSGAVLDDSLREVVRDFLVAVELHRVLRAALGGRAQIRRVAEHLGERDAGLHGERVASRLLTLYAAAATRQVADHVAQELLGRDDLDGHDRLEQHGLGLLRGVLEGQRAGDLERDLRGVGVVVLAVGQRDSDVDHREAGPDAGLERLLDALLDRRNELRRDRAPLDLVDEVEALAGRRLHVDVDDPVLARATRLADELALHLLGVAADGLAVGHLRAADGRLDAELALHAVHE